MHSRTKVQLSRAEIDAVTDAAFSSTVVSVEECTDGMFNAAYRVDVRGHGPVFLKVAPPDGIPVMTYEKGLMRTEAQVHRLIQGTTTFPVADLLHADLSRRVIDRDYLILSYLPGTPWDKVAEEARQMHIESLKKDLGGCLGQLYGIEGEGFGYPADLDHPASRQWDTAFLHMVEQVLVDGETMRVELPLPAETIRQIFFDNRRFLQDVDSPRLVHFDVWAGNVIVSESPSGYEIEGIVDCERAFFGDPYADFVSSFGLFRDVEHEPAVLAGYQASSGTALVFDVSARRRLNLYRAYLLLIMLVEMPYREYPPRYRAYRPVLARWLHNILAAVQNGEDVLVLE